MMDPLFLRFNNNNGARALLCAARWLAGADAFLLRLAPRMGSLAIAYVCQRKRSSAPRLYGSH